jgi:hypothetical protein
MDHTAWKLSLDHADDGSGLTVVWVDYKGGRHVTVVDLALFADPP